MKRIDWKFVISLPVASALMLGAIWNEREAEPTPTGDDERVAAQQQEFRKHQREAIDLCYNGKGIAALGFGFTVVCIREHEATEYDPEKDAIVARVVFARSTSETQP